MAHHKSAKKRIRTNERRRLRNQAAMSKKTLVKKVHSSDNKDDAEKNLKEAVSYIDKNVTKGRLHKNTAARKKSSLTKFVNGLKG